MKSTLNYFENNNQLYRMLLSILFLFIGDMIWFSISKKFYRSSLDNITKSKGFKWYGGVIAWSLLGLAIGLQQPKSIKDAAIYGAFIGFICYGVFNGTMLAIIPEWKVQVALADWLWGTLICTIVSILVYKIL